MLQTTHTTHQDEDSYPQHLLEENSKVKWGTNASTIRNQSQNMLLQIGENFTRKHSGPRTK